jgi:hypothetical protein
LIGSFCGNGLYLKLTINLTYTPILVSFEDYFVESADVLNKMLRILFVILFVFISGVSFSIAQSVPDRNDLEQWTFPPIDFQNVREGNRIDPRLKIALEEMRKVLGEAKIILLQQPSNYSSLFQNWSSCTVQYVALLREAGLDVTAEKTLDTFPKNPPGLRSQLLHSNPIRTKRKDPNNTDLKKSRIITDTEISQLAQQLWRKANGTYFYETIITLPFYSESSRREFSGLDRSFNVPMSFDEEKTDQPLRSFRTYKEWATDFVAKYSIEKQNILNKLKTSSTQDVHFSAYSEILPYAVLFSIMGFQDDARQTVQKAKELAQIYVKQEYERNSYSYSSYKLKEPIIRHEEIWRTIITAYIIIGEYQSAIETLDEMRESFIKLYAAGEAPSWRHVWQSSITKLLQWIAVENSIEQAAEYMKQYSDFMAGEDVISNTAHSLALRAAKEGRTADIEKYLQFARKENISQQEIYLECCRYVFQHTSLEQTSVLLNEYFPQIASIHLRDAPLNELGILFLKTGDENSARKIFDRINDSIKINETQAMNETPVRNFQDRSEQGKLLAERYKAGWTKPTLQFLETLTDPIFRCQIFCSFVPAVADEKGEKRAEVIEVTKKFIRLAYESALKTDATPISPPLNSYSYQSHSYIEDNRSIQSRLLWLVIRTTLMTDHLTLTRQIIHKERTRTKNEIVIENQEMFFNDDNYLVSRLIAKEDLSSAIFVLKETNSSTALKYQIALQLAVKLIESPPPNNEIVREQEQKEEQHQRQKQTPLFGLKKLLRERK